MPDQLKYAIVERERRFLVRAIPDGATHAVAIEDHYLLGTRLRLREMIASDGTIVRKLGHKVRLGDDPSTIACTSLYLDDAEWELLRELPSRRLRKTRHHIERDGVVVAVDQLEDGTLLAEIDDGDATPAPVPPWLDVISEVTGDEAWVGASLAQWRHG